ncbi:pseudouridine synthase [Hypnocyclicus thermotrophus]|uniref:pseudouridine synthase n=1 Tax=Hypnocyclicus thermotrophus TaxID=1627895 RepID=UPI0010663CE4|nr:pseudouridine synthase [Hypnocyclicus thermotrophus]
MRINKFLASIGIGSRREIDKMILDNRIKINGQFPEPGIKVNCSDTIEIDGEKISLEIEKKVYYKLNKPKGYLSAVKDTREKTIVELIKTDKRIYPIGRLDLETEGLILLTNDGEIFNKIMHPKSKIYKKYFVVVKNKLSKFDIDKLENGIELEEGLTLPAIIENVEYESNKTSFYISIREGRNRQIRRMIKAIDNRVIYLKRVKIGKIELGDLKVGEYKKLTEEELNYLKTL